MNRPFALALGGGSARGFAHIGVIRYLEEQNIIPNKITGTSMGAIIGGLYAMGKDSYQIEEIVKKVGFFSVMNWLPEVGILSIEKIHTVLAEHLGKATFADTKIPLAIIATNLSDASRVIFTEGSLVDAICASIAIPWVFKPYTIGSMYFVDGWMVENLPLSPCDGLPIIASSVLMPFGIEMQNIPFFKKWLSLVYDASNMLLYQQEKQNIEKYDDILVFAMREPTTHYMEFGSLELMIQEGYKEAKNSNILSFL